MSLEFKKKVYMDWVVSQSEGLNVDPNKLMSLVSLSDDNRNQRQNVISACVSLINITNDFKDLDYSKLAGRLKCNMIFLEATLNREGIDFSYDDNQSMAYLQFVKKAVENNLYAKDISEKYSDEDLMFFGENIDFTYDKGFDYAGMNLLDKRYLVQKDGAAFELPQEMYMTVAALLASEMKDSVSRKRKAIEFYHAMASRKISLATPLLMNLRRTHGCLVSCYITSFDDNIENIFYVINELAQISKNGGGCGLNCSRIRSNGSSFQGVPGGSRGVLPWIKIVNDTMIAVSQGSGARAGACTVALDVWHGDILEFIEMQTENGDLRRKSFDIFPQIVIPDLFMRRAEANEYFTLLDPHEVYQELGLDLVSLYGEDFDKAYLKAESSDRIQFKKSINAKELYKRILKTSVETGLPYQFFKDNVNNVNPNKHEGMIGSANLCVESYSNFNVSKVKSSNIDENNQINNIELGETHTCNLVSLNLAELNENEIEYNTCLAVEILDNAIDLSVPAVDSSVIHNNKYRIIGVGTMGLHDYLVKHKKSYKTGLDVANKLYERIAFAGLSQSCELAKTRGAYPAYIGSEWSKGIFFGRDIKKISSESEFSPQWSVLWSNIKQHGLRNGGLFAIAPNTSTSPLVGATASILPCYSKFFIDQNSKGAPPVFPPLLSQDTFWYYQENTKMDQQLVIDMVSVIQKWVDQGISMELMINLNNPDFKAKDFYNLYMNAWKQKLKTVYYIRSVAKRETKEDCISCSG